MSQSLACSAAVAALALFSPLASAATFVVDTTSDVAITACTAAPNDCSLRGAIAAGNASAGPDIVNFNIPTSDAGCVPATGICRITLASEIAITAGPITIDGYTQPGALPNTIPAQSGGLNSVLKIELVSGLPAGHSALVSSSSVLTLRGLAIAEFTRDSVSLTGGAATQSNLEGNYLGTNASGAAMPVRNSVAIATSLGGVQVGGISPSQRNLISNNIRAIDSAQNSLLSIQGNLIGTNRDGTAAMPNDSAVGTGGGSSASGNVLIGGSDPGARNVISGNQRGVGFAGIYVSARVQGNLIGTDVTGAAPLANVLGAVNLNPGSGASVGIFIGGLLPAEANVIAFNNDHGVFTQGSRGSVLGNSTFANRLLGIGSNTSRRLPNDPNDLDSNLSNLGQNFPDVSAFTVAGTLLNLSYRVDSATVNSAYPLRVEFFKADGDEGRSFLFADSYLAAEAQ